MEGLNMKSLLLSAAAVAALSLAPAVAQSPSERPAEPPVTEAAPPEEAAAAEESGVIVQGVEPSKVLGAIDTEELVDEPQEETAEAAESIDQPVEQTAEAEDEQSSESIEIASAEALPAEVAEVVQDGDYTTEDLVKAQLASLENAEPLDGESES
jgi:hypothetical protein